MNRNERFTMSSGQMSPAWRRTLVASLPWLPAPSEPVAVSGRVTKRWAQALSALGPLPLTTPIVDSAGALTPAWFRALNVSA